jgi:hypothetical protein
METARPRDRFLKLVGPPGLEPGTRRLIVGSSACLSYGPFQSSSANAREFALPGVGFTYPHQVLSV